MIRKGFVETFCVSPHIDEMNQGADLFLKIEKFIKLNVTGTNAGCESPQNELKFWEHCAC